jgi:DNA-binding NarL/FixJ family response regulator
MKDYAIVLADDHILFRQGIKKIIEEIQGWRVVGEANDGLELLDILKDIRPNLIILDISMPNLRGLEAAREIKARYPGIKILLLTMHKKKDFIQEAVNTEVDGFLVKEDADTELLQAVEAISRGQKFFSPLLSEKLADLVRHAGKGGPLTRREKEIIKLLAEGKSSKEVAQLLYISIYTVRRHRDNIMKKLEFKNLAELVRFALEEGYTSNRP